MDADSIGSGRLIRHLTPDHLPATGGGVAPGSAEEIDEHQPSSPVAGEVGCLQDRDRRAGVADLDPEAGVGGPQRNAALVISGARRWARPLR
jgi:hypothetical protein